MPASYSYTGLWLAKFAVSSCHERATLVNSPASNDLAVVAPPSMYTSGMSFKGFTGNPLTLPTGSADPNDTNLSQVADQLSDVSVLGSTPSSAPTLLIYPHQYPQFSSQDVFFEQDGDRTFFVTPKITRRIWNWGEVEATGFANLLAPVSYYASNYVPVVNAPPSPEPLRAAENVAAEAVPKGSFAKSNILAGGVLSWGGVWFPPAPITYWVTDYLYQPFDHPYVCNFVRAVKQYGVDGLLKWPAPSNTVPTWPLPPSPTPLQLVSKDYFASAYNPRAVVTPYPQDLVDFSYSGPYSQYNWELFYHGPMLLASKLSQNQRFQEAQNWLHYIFDPTNLYPIPPAGAASNFPYGYWKVKPFYEQTAENSIAQLVTMLDSSAPGNQAAIQNFQQQVVVSMADPFKPFALARLRTTAFQKATVMKYLDNLIAWADNLFRQNTRESINEATQLYILADQLLGPRPQQVERGGSKPLAYKDLAPKLVAGDLSDPLVQLENALPVSAGQLVPQVPLPYVPDALPTALYFGIPPNPQLLSYWDTVADRLYKIRHCQNIEGKVQQLPLLAPPISPGLLIRAAAAGMDLTTLMYMLMLPPPLYHFPYLYKQAIDFCKEVHTLGTMLQSALEKKDTEHLLALRAMQEATLLGLMHQEYQQRVNQAQLEQTDLEAYRQRVQDKHDWYAGQPDKYPGEDEGMGALWTAYVAGELIAAHDLGASVMALIPGVDAGATGAGGSPTAKVKFGGKNLSDSMKHFAEFLKSGASALRDKSKHDLASAHVSERKARFQLEAKLAQDELNEIDTTRAKIAQLKVDIANQQLADFEARMQNAQDVATFLLGKYTKEDLYDWMIGQISGVYFQSYQLAYQMAQRAEAVYNMDLGNYDADYVSFLQPGYWDTLHQGLLAAEGLMYDIQRMQSSFVDNNFREFEIIRPISLNSLDPVAFNTLKTTGTAFFNLPESLFDADYPGHFMRRIKYAGVTFAFSTATRPKFVNCTLSLVNSSIRIHATPPTPYARTGAGDTRFHDLNQVEQIVTSNGGSSSTADNGMFETTVHYIITDDRLLTFEHSGVIGTWQVEFSKNNPGFDPSTVTDIVLQIEYLSRYGGDALKVAAGG